MRNKPKTVGQKIADTMTMETFMNELNSSVVGKLFEDENGEPDTILLMQKYLDEGRGSSLEQILMSRAIGELVKLRDQVIALKEELLDTIEGAGVLQEKIERLETNSTTLYPKGDWRGMSRSSMTNGGDCLLSIENINKICREDEQNQLAEMLGLQEEANFNNEQFNKGDMK
jgi:hypothetical protein